MTPISYLKYLNQSRYRPFVKMSANWFWYEFNIYFAIYELFSDEMVTHVDVLYATMEFGVFDVWSRSRCHNLLLLRTDI